MRKTEQTINDTMISSRRCVRYNVVLSGLFLPVEFRVRVCLSVCLSVGLFDGNEQVFWKNGSLDRDAVWFGGWCVPNKPCIICGPNPLPTVRGILGESGDAK